MQLNVTPLTRHKAYTGHLNGDFWGRRASTGRSAGITGHTQTRYKAYTGLASGDFWGSERGALCTPQYWEGVTRNARRQALQRSRQDQMEFFLHLFYNSLNTA